MNPMKNLSVNFSLNSILLVLVAIILSQGVIGIYVVRQSNFSTALVHEISQRIIMINDSYKDTTRARSALTRVYASAKENDAGTDKEAAIKGAKNSLSKAETMLKNFENLPAYQNEDANLKSDLLKAGGRLIKSIEDAYKTLEKQDYDNYSAINKDKLTSQGAEFSSLLEKFQSNADKQIQSIMEARELEYQTTVKVYVLAIIAALLVAVAAHLATKKIILKPLDHAVQLLDQVAKGDLTADIKVDSTNEIGQLIAAIESMRRDLSRTVGQVRTVAESIHVSSQEIAAGNMDLSSRTESQASSLEETSASMEELTSVVANNAANSKDAKKFVESSVQVAARGGEVMEQVMSTMNDINAASGKIVEIISVIDGIAFQTNILSLNAAVEAARAGEQGRGFAVVASEVRNLAQRSASAAKEIKSLIDSTVSRVDAGARLVEQAGSTIGELVSSVKRVSEIVNEISNASQEQAEGIHQVNIAVVQMDEVTQQNVALVEEAAAATQSLNDQASTLSSTMSTFKINASPIHHASSLTRRVA
ncbi:methyl-accepting chemotaxis protein [Undibacterium sp. Ji49W]|uniref:methyl-accepting chemotaxis protein n=1 Tax=Undibacterium sp. Ji49W TaxID=3413040 RepID=UPI003BF21EDF